jgi:hypothetical protein
MNNKMNCELRLIYDTPALRHTGSRNLMGPKTLPTIWGTYLKLVTNIDDLSCVHRQFSCLGTDLSHFLH